MLHDNPDVRKEALQQLASATPEGRKRRRAWQRGISHTCHEFHGLGVEMGQHYTGPGVHTSDEAEAYTRPGRAAEDQVLYYEPSTYPGCRLPHVWLNRSIPGKPVSTIDLAGHGAFTLFTGIGGDCWKPAASGIASKLGVPLQVYSIGFRQDWEDMYFDWERVRGVDESGAVLVRPDRFVAWRVVEALDGVEACGIKLTQVMKSVLGYYCVEKCFII